MAIISAGVIMNIIFAFIFASIAYGLGVNYQPAVVGTMFPGEAAWMADLRPGDQIVQLGDIKKPRFQDLRQQVALGDIEHGVPLLVKRKGVEEVLSFTVMPERKPDGLAPRIGMAAAETLELHEQIATIPYSLAAAARPEFQPGDVIERVNGQEVEDYAELHAVLARRANEPLTFTVRRKASGEQRSAESTGTVPSETIDITVPPKPMKFLGLEMRLGPIVAVRPNSPAAAAGLKPGDQLLSLDDQPVGNPVTLPQRSRRLSGQKVAIGVHRKGEEEPVTLEIEPRDVPWFEVSPADGTPMSAPALGIAYRVENIVERVVEGSPAAKAGIKPKDEVVSAVVTPPDDLELPEEIAFLQEASTITFDAEHANWPRLFHELQNAFPGTKIQLTLKDKRQLTLEPVESDEWFIPSDRGLALKTVSGIRTASSFGEALSFGKRETIDALTLVVRFLRKVGTQVSPMAAGGPFTIFSAAAASAKEGFSTLLIFLCMLSANLAVINFLPIPVLDGGHMVFLALEGIRGKPVSERVFLAFTYAGFVLILMLMIFVLGLDISRMF
jgi:regulator of sigma E protease